MHSNAGRVSRILNLGKGVYTTKSLLAEMPRICVEIRLVSHNSTVWFQKPLNQCSVERFAVLSFFYDNSQYKHKFKGMKREGIGNTAFGDQENMYTEERKKLLKIFFLKTTVEKNINLKVIHLVFL